MRGTDIDVIDAQYTQSVRLGYALADWSGHEFARPATIVE